MCFGVLCVVWSVRGGSDVIMIPGLESAAANHITVVCVQVCLSPLASVWVIYFSFPFLVPSVNVRF